MISTLTATDLLTRYRQVREATERLADPLGPEDQTVQSMPDVSPTKWHRAHTTWFFETFVLVPFVGGYRRYDEDFAYLFNSYYEGAGPRHLRAERGLITRPGIGEVAAYRQHVDDAMAAMLRASDELGARSAEALALVELGLHHEQQHQELLLMDIQHVLSCNPLQPAYRPVPALPPVVALDDRSPTWLEVPAGLVEVGHDGAGFAFDHEGPRHRVWLEPFRLRTRLVTAGEWVAFIEDGGYRRSELWLSDGWATVQAHGWEAPLYWSGGGDGWERFTLGGTRAVADHEPVTNISHYEADAFARWAGARLPTEFEWEHAVEAAGGSSDGSGSTSLQQVSSDVWQWTSSAFLAYPGFAPAQGAVGEYNGKFMANQMVLRGGSIITPPGHVRSTYRNFFPPHARWMVAGVRLAADS